MTDRKEKDRRGERERERERERETERETDRERGTGSKFPRRNVLFSTAQEPLRRC